MNDFELTCKDHHFIVEFLKDCRSATTFSDLLALVERFNTEIWCLDDIAASIYYSDGHIENLFNDAQKKQRSTNCPHPFVADACAIVVPRTTTESKACSPDEMAVINLNGSIASACQKGTGKVESTCMTAKLTTPTPPIANLEILQLIMPHLHDALNRIALERQSLIHNSLFTKRELEVLHWVREGKTNWEIATIIDVSERTVKFHLKNIFGKMGVTRRSQAAAMANEFHPNVS